ncbi:fungal-specific transcription factor domain-containing protein [Lipomyces doorenjongii]
MSTTAPTNSSPDNELSRIVSVAKVTRGHSCALCQQRKVRCSGQKPCSNCVKAGAECRTPATSSRRKRKLPEEDILLRLRRYEEVIIKHGLKVEDEDCETPSDEQGMGTQGTHKASRPSGSGTDNGKLIMERGNSRYIESHPWTALSDEIQDSGYIHQGSSEDETVDSLAGHYPECGSLLFGRLMVNNAISSCHPQPVQILRMWQTFIDNVNPLVKLLHAPTVQQLIVEASGRLDKLSRSTEALMFAIYHSSVVSLRNEDCESMMGESRSVLLARYSTATQQALINAGVLRTANLKVLQALTLYLLSIRQHCDPDSLWILAGIAIRIGQRIGLHREIASSKLSIFEAEIRRRLWWQILILDNRSAQLSGIGSGLEAYDFSEAWRPLNINDFDLSPTMKELPAEHTGVTEMLFCSVRYEIGVFMRQTESWKATAVSMQVKDKAINELENRLEQKYLRYCDTSIPLHLLSSLLARTAVCQMRLKAHHPRQYPDKGANMPQSEKDMLFSTSLKMIEYDNLTHASKCIQGYLWHVNVFFQLDAFIYILSELRARVAGELVDKAWQQVNLVYDYHPEMITDRRHALYFAIGNLAVKAWEKRVGCAEHTQGIYQLTTPHFISALYLQRTTEAAQKYPSTAVAKGKTAYVDGETPAAFPDQGNENHSSDISIDNDPSLLTSYIPLDMSPIDWEYWQTLFEGCEAPPFDGSGQ